MKAVLAGSFDPFTLGHLEIVSNALEIFDSVKILVNAKSSSKFYKVSVGKRAEIIKESVKHLPNVEIAILDCLLPDALKEDEVLIRGLRNTTDYAYEENLFETYQKLSDNRIKCVYLMPKENKAISSSVVRELLKYNSKKYVDFVASDAAELIKEYYTSNPVGFSDM